MGLFSFGSTESRSEGSSLDFSFGRSGSTAGSFDRATAGSRAGGVSQQAIAFQPIFSRLFGNAASRALGEIDSPAQMLFAGGMDFLDTLQGNAGVDALARRVTGPNEALQTNLSALQENIGRFFKEEINPAITTEAIGAGALGGGRQGVAQGRAARAVTEQFTQGAASLIQADQAQRDEAATNLANILTEGAALGLESLPGLLQLGVEGEVNLAPLSALSQILGPATVLTQARDFSRSFSESLGESFQESFGEDFAFGTSRQTSESSGFNLGL